jgi:hypothetical protein
MTLYLVCDISGSMGDGGKPFTMRTAVMAVAQWVRLGYAHAEIRLCGWASETRHFLDWSPKDEFPAELLSCGGPSNGEALIRWLGEKPEGKVLLLTDGFWTRDEARVLKHWMEGLPPDTLRVIKIGADANPQLKGPNMFAPEDLFVALDDWLEGGGA